MPTNNSSNKTNGAAAGPVGPEVLLTGATGFFGGHLLSALRSQGISASVLTRASTWDGGAAERLGRPWVVHGSPLELPSAALPGVAGVRVIIHAAGLVKHASEPPPELHTLNVEGTLNMVRLAAALRARLVFISSSGTVGCFRYPDIQADEDAPYAEALAGRWPYYSSKIRAEREARRLADKLGVELVIVRPPVLFGPEDARFRATGHITSLLLGHVPVVPAGGMHFTDVRDVADAVARLTRHSRPRGIYHFPGTASTLAEFFKMVQDVSGAKLPDRRVPRWLLESVTRTVSRSARLLRVTPPHWIPDPVLAEMAGCFWGLSTLWTDQELGYRPRPARQTLIDTIEWLERHHPKLRALRAGGIAVPNQALEPRSPTAT